MTFTGLPFWLVLTFIGVIAGGLVLLHLLTRRFRRVRVPTGMFWQVAVSRTRARNLFHRLRHPLTLLLLLVIASLILLAVGRPEASALRPAAISRILVVDVGMTMGDLPPAGASRIELARHLVIEEARAADPVGLVAAGATPVVAHGFEDDRRDLPAQVDRLVARGDRADLRAAVRVARTMARGAKTSTSDIVVITDAAGAKTLPTSLKNIRVRTVGQSLDNTAISYVHAVSHRSSQDKAQLSVGLVRWAHGHGSVRLVLSREGRVLREVPVILEGQDVRQVHLADVPTGDVPLIVTIADGGGLSCDDKVTVALAPHAPVAVKANASCPPALRLLLSVQPWVESVRLADTGPLAEWMLQDGTVGQVRASAAKEHLSASETLATPDGTPIGGRLAPGRPLPPLPDGSEPRLISGDDVHAAISYAPDEVVLQLSEAIIDPDSSCWRRRGFVAYMTQCLAEIAPQSGRSVYATVPQRDLERGNLLKAGEITSPPMPTSSPDQRPWFEILLLAAALLAGMETLLYLRGRIA